MILLEIVVSFMKVAVLAFGGAYAAFPLVEQEVVINRAWMTYTEFLDLVALDEITPGPIIINCATFVGMKVAGIPGAIAASIGCSLPSILIVSLLIFFYRRYKSLPMMQEVLKALKCMAAALILTSFVKMFTSVILPNGITDISFYALILAVLSYVLMHKFKVNPLLVMLGCGTVNLLFYLIK